MSYEPHLIEGIPSGKVSRDTEEFRLLEAVGQSIVSSVFADGDAKNMLGRWLQRRRFANQNQYLGQYGWNVDRDGNLYDVPVVRISFELPPEPENADPAANASGDPWEEGRIQISGGYVVDTHRGNQIIAPSERYHMKARLG